MDKKRYYLIDSLRGIALILMVVYHTLWDLSGIFGKAPAWFTPTADYLIQRTTALLFLSISGFSFGLGRRHFKSAVRTLSGGLIVAAATYIILPRAAAYFGVLVFLGSCTLIMIPLRRLLDRISPYITAPLCLIFFILLENLRNGCVGFLNFRLEMPTSLYKNLFTAYLGFPPESFASLDYFPIFPWIFLFIFGYAVYKMISDKNRLNRLTSPRIPPLEWLGRHTLFIYLIHQPLILGMLYLTFKIL